MADNKIIAVGSAKGAQGGGLARTILADPTMRRKKKIVHLSAGTGRTFWGPGDMYTFLVTGEQTGGAYFVMEALVPPGGGPPPHIHRNEDETFYIVEGQCSIRLGDQKVNAAAGDFVNVPRGIVHCFRNEGTSTMRMILTFSPSGIEKFFEETLEPALDRRSGPPPNIQAVADRFVAAGPKYGIQFFASYPEPETSKKPRIGVSDVH